MKCTVCEKECPEYGTVFLNADGDPACSEECKEKYKQEMDHFLNVTIHDDKKFAEWLGVREDAL